MSDHKPTVDDLLSGWRAQVTGPMDPAAAERIRAAVVHAAATPVPAKRRFALPGRFVLAPISAGLAALIVTLGWSAPASSPLHAVRLAREGVVLALPGADRAGLQMSFAESRLAQAMSDSAATQDLSEARDQLNDARNSLGGRSDQVARLNADIAQLQSEVRMLGLCGSVPVCSAFNVIPPIAMPSTITAVTPTPTPRRPTTAPTPGPSASPTATPTITPHPAPTPAPPTILFADNFDGDSLGTAPAGWTVASGDWTVVADGANHVVHNSASGVNRLEAGNPGWGDVSVSASLRLDAGFTSSTMAGLATRYQDSSNYYMCKIWQGNLYVARWQSSVFTVLSSTPYAPVAGAWQTMTFTAHGSTLTCQAGGTVVQATDTVFTSGRIALLATENIDADNVVVRP